MAERAAERLAMHVAMAQALASEETAVAISAAARDLAARFDAGGTLLIFGNGGSAADAQHIAAELVGRFLLERAPLPALALADNGASVTAIANDYTFVDVFARQVAGLGVPGDVVLAISTSGSSPNVLAGVAEARARDMHTIGLTGADGGALAPAVDVCIAVPADSTPRIQEAHTVVGHLLCEIVERELARRP